MFSGEADEVDYSAPQGRQLTLRRAKRQLQENVEHKEISSEEYLPKKCTAWRGTCCEHQLNYNVVHQRPFTRMEKISVGEI